jgi:ribosomal-protein-alanine N-acetyltransferase
MTGRDISKVHNIECLLFNDPWPKKSFKTEIKQKNISFPFVVEETDEIVGYIICWYYMNELHIGNIAVVPQKQRQGIGKYMLRKVFENFFDYNNAFLEVRESNEKAINLYMTFGFETIHRRKAYYPNGEDALVMVKNRLLNC